MPAACDSSQFDPIPKYSPSELADATTGLQILTRNFDGAFDDIFEFQDQITASVAMVVEPQIQASELERSRRDRPESLAAYDLYLRAHAKFFSETAEGAAEAEVLLAQALALEPDNASILSLTTISLMAKHVRGFAPIRPEDTVRCGALARRGIQNAGGDAAAIARCAMDRFARVSSGIASVHSKTPCAALPRA